MFRTTGVEIHHSKDLVERALSHVKLPPTVLREASEASLEGPSRLYNVVSALRCRKCGQVIWSCSRHHFNPCACGAVAIDGGRDYTRIVGNGEDFEYFNLWIPMVKGAYQLGRLRPEKEE